jgi:hypothetical protein
MSEKPVDLNVEIHMKATLSHKLKSKATDWNMKMKLTQNAVAQGYEISLLIEEKFAQGY